MIIIDKKTVASLKLKTKSNAMEERINSRDEFQMPHEPYTHTIHITYIYLAPTNTHTHTDSQQQK